MTFLAVYFIVNIAVAVILDRKRLSVALISHVVMFSVMSVFVLFCSGVEFISQAAMRLLGENAYEILLSAMCFGETELLLPIVIIQQVLTLQFALVTAAFTCEVIHYLQARKPRKRAKRPKYAPQARVNTTLPVLRKLCYLNQSILCYVGFRRPQSALAAGSVVPFVMSKYGNTGTARARVDNRLPVAAMFNSKVNPTGQTD